MKKAFLIIAIAVAAMAVQAQDNRVLMTIAEEDVTVNEFLAIYNKNNTNNVVDKKSMEEYLDLFINFKLKVAEAEMLGMDTASKFIGELAGYRKQLAAPYLVDRETTDQLVKEAYDRMNQDVEAYHILLRVSPDAPAADTMKAYKRVKAMRQSIKNLDDFKRIAKQESEDPSAKDNSGYLGYFTAFKMVYPFENAAYNTKTKSISSPVRTRFGYHLIYVSDKRAARGEIKASHIMIKSTPEDSEADQSAAKAKIDEIYGQLKKGDDFAQLAREYSQDQGTAQKGGKLPWFGTGRMVETFEDAAFNLSADGEYSQPVRTDYGWHIILREQYRGIEDFKSLESTIKRRIERDVRGEKGRESLITRLKEEYSLVFDNKNKDKAERLVNASFLIGKWNPDAEAVAAMKDGVMTISDPGNAKLTRTFTQNDYLEFLRRNQPRDKAEQVLSSELSTMWAKFIDESVIAFEDLNLENKYPEFKALMQEYHDGILLFDLMDQKVWSKAVKDSAGLDGYYQANKNDFMWPMRVDASVFIAANEDIAKSTIKMVKKRSKKNYSDEDIMTEMNVGNPLNLSIRSGLFAKGENDLLDQVSWEKGVSQPMQSADKSAFIEIREVLQPQPKKLDEARGVITSAYQGYLEAQWIEDLRGKYSSSVDKSVFNDINR